MGLRADIRRGRSGDASFGTRRRVVPALVVGLLGLFVIESLVSSTALAVNFTTSDKEFKIYSNYVQGVYGAGYLALNDGHSAVSQTGVTELGFKTADLAGLCAISTDSIGPVGTTSLVILAGVPVKASFNPSAVETTDGAGGPIQVDADGLLTGASLTGSVKVTDMFLNSGLIKAYGNKFRGLNLGQDAATVGDSAGLEFETDQGGVAPGAGNMGLFADRMNLSGLDGSSYGINLAGSVKLPDMKIRVVSGTATQADCATLAGS